MQQAVRYAARHRKRAFPPAHLRRLRELKRRWDPTCLFHDNSAIEPAGS
ncbi:BBE domain-containing protein [Nonomuraea sp. NPDC049421]